MELCCIRRLHIVSGETCLIMFLDWCEILLTYYYEEVVFEVENKLRTNDKLKSKCMKMQTALTSYPLFSAVLVQF